LRDFKGQTFKRKFRDQKKNREDTPPLAKSEAIFSEDMVGKTARDKKERIASWRGTAGASKEEEGSLREGPANGAQRNSQRLD